MSKTITMQLPTQAEHVAKFRSTHSVDGTIAGGTKAHGNKGKHKAYNRRKETRNWKREAGL